MNKLTLITISLCLAAPVAWAGNSVFANGFEIAAKSAAGKHIAAFPDVSFTPGHSPAPPPGIPIPYPNTGRTSDTATGGTTDKVGGKLPRLEYSPYYSPAPSQPRTPKPPAKPVHKGKMYLQPYPFGDVKRAPQPRVRHIDITTNNHG